MDTTQQQTVSKDLYDEPPDVLRSQEEKDYLERYEYFARLVGEEGLSSSSQGADPSSWSSLANHEGALAVVGSGIKAVCDFTSEAISIIKYADKVFYCVADPVTEIYIKSIKPDAEDLYVFYSNNKERYHTYVQMAEMLLYDVRRGLKVAAVYYGHPGVFVLPSHRAVEIARKQGLRAFLVPAVSALDCLVADVGFDPSYPGLQILEATDMLLRRRPILNDRHVVIWQVGCVGNPGYRRQGYLKEHFSVLLDYLEEFYSPSDEITHYIGSQFPTVDPVIECCPLSKYRSPEVSKKVTGISTFYIPPTKAVPYNYEMAEKLQLTIQGSPASATQAKGIPSTTRKYDMYGSKEQKAIKDLANFKVSPAHAFTPLTASSNYIEELSLNPSKLESHLSDPKKELKKHPEIHANHAQLLSKGLRLATRAAVKPHAINSAQQAAVRILTDPVFAHSYKEEMKTLRKDPDADKKLTAWLNLHGYNTNPADVQAALENLQKSTLLPWTNHYRSLIGELVIIGAKPPAKGSVMFNSIPINNFTVENQVLKWSSGEHNDSSGVITFSLEDQQPLANGKIWKKSEKEPSQDNFHGTSPNFKSPIQFWEGRYKTVVKSGKTVVTGQEFEISFPRGVQGGIITLGGKQISPFTFDKTTLCWSNGKITFYVQAKTVSNPSIAKFYGKLWAAGQSEPSSSNFWGTLDQLYLHPWGGVYKTYVDKSGGNEFIVQPSTYLLPNSISYGSEIKKWQFDNPVVSWSASQGNTLNGELTFLVYSDGARGFKGKMWLSGSPKPAKDNAEGVVDNTYLSSWSSTYYTKILDASGNKTTPSNLLQIIGGKDMNSSSVILQGVEVKKWNFAGAKNTLSWKDTDNNNNATITFNVGKPTSAQAPGVKFFGKFWKKGETEPTKTNWWGSFQAPDQTGDGGSSQHSSSSLFTAKNIGYGIFMGLLCFGIIEILRRGITYLVKKLWEKYKKSQEDADEEDNDEIRAREREEENNDQPDDQNNEPEPDNNDPDDPPPDDDAPPDDAPPDDAPPDDAPPDDAPPDDAPPDDAPPDDAPPDDAPPDDAPPDDAPPDDAPPDDAPPDDVPPDDIDVFVAET